MFSNPSSFQFLDKPVERVSWFEVIEYCNKRSINEGLEPVYEYKDFGTNPADWPFGWNQRDVNYKNIKFLDQASGYRLPTEMEWQYAASGGDKSKGFTYSGSNDIKDVAWYRSNSNNKTQEVGKLSPNELGLYDMSGNVWEWCWDIYGDFPKGHHIDPKGISKGRSRVRRGGSADQASRYCTNTYRYGYAPTVKNPALGFRIARNAQ
jgi:formylglycine-generating enzyme required for sulfatase activity